MTDIQKMDMEQLKEFKSKLELTLKMVDNRIDSAILSECSICMTFEIGFDDLPDGWDWRAQRILCKKHLEKFDKL